MAIWAEGNTALSQQLRRCNPVSGLAAHLGEGVSWTLRDDAVWAIRKKAQVSGFRCQRLSLDGRQYVSSVSLGLLGDGPGMVVLDLADHPAGQKELRFRTRRHMPQYTGKWDVSSPALKHRLLIFYISQKQLTLHNFTPGCITSKHHVSTVSRPYSVLAIYLITRNMSSWR